MEPRSACSAVDPVKYLLWVQLPVKTGGIYFFNDFFWSALAQVDEVPKIMVHTNISCPLNPERRWNDLWCRNMQITCSGSRIIKVMIVATPNVRSLEQGR